jgi:anti-sigma regulatory factor (Ser/Thr protein kinase)
VRLAARPGLVEVLPAPEGQLHLRLANDIAAIAAALPALQQFIASHALPPRIANRLEVVFEELATNPIRHGFQPGSEQVLHVTAAMAGCHVRLDVEDDGRRFDPTAHPAAPALATLETAPEGGLGIALVAKLARRFASEPPGLPGMVNRVVVELAVE